MIVDWEEGGVTGRGGLMLVTDGETISPTKFKAKGDLRMVNMDLLLGALGGINGGRAQSERLLYFADAAVKISEAIGGLNKAIEEIKGSPKSKPFGFVCDGKVCKGDTIPAENFKEHEHENDKVTPIYEY